MSAYDLAQLNIAKLASPLDTPELADFVANLDRINTLAEQSPGFVWRFDVPAGEAPAAESLFGRDYIVNMSTWRSRDALFDYVYKSAHAPIMARRREWFLRSTELTSVLWWVPAGSRPTLSEAAKRLEQLRHVGASKSAFTFKQAWPAPDQV